MVTEPAAYAWSSPRAYLGRETIHWLTTDPEIDAFGTRLGLRAAPPAVGSLDELATAVCTKHSINLDALRARDKSISPVRAEFAVSAIGGGIATLKAVADFPQRHPTVVARLTARHGQCRTLPCPSKCSNQGVKLPKWERCRQVPDTYVTGSLSGTGTYICIPRAWSAARREAGQCPVPTVTH